MRVDLLCQYVDDAHAEGSRVRHIDRFGKTYSVIRYDKRYRITRCIRECDTNCPPAFMRECVFYSIREQFMQNEADRNGPVPADVDSFIDCISLSSAIFRAVISGNTANPAMISPLLFRTGVALTKIHLFSPFLFLMMSSLFFVTLPSLIARVRGRSSD